jgi:hypothetical protein
MALRWAAQRLLQAQQLGTSSMAYSSKPTVFDKMVQFFVIDKTGVRHTVRGLEGMTLAKALTEYGRFPNDYFMPNPFNPVSTDCHVYIAYDYIEKLPQLPEELQQQQQRILEDFARKKTRDNSKMAHYVTLSPALNGITVALGDMEPWQTA